MKIVVCGNYGAQNIGDEMILKGLLNYLKSTYPHAQIQVMSANPPLTEKQHQIKVLPQLPSGIRSIFKSLFSPPKATIEAIRNCDLFVLGGGGLFASQSLKADIIWWAQTRLALKYHKPIHLLGHSLGLSKNWFEKYIIKKIFISAQKITVRDTTSKKNLERLGIKNIETQQDFAFNYPTTSPHTNSNTIAIAFRYTKEWPPSLKLELTRLCNWLIEGQKLKIHFLNFQQGPATDDKIHHEIAADIQQKEQIKFINPQSIEEAEKEIAHSKFLIGMRLHPIITALKTKTPFLAISYGEKITNLLTDLHFQKNLILLQEANFETLKDKFLDIASQTLQK